MLFRSISVPLAAVAYTLLKRDLRARIAVGDGEGRASGETPPEG